METGWHATWSLPMPECRALAGKRQGTGALQDASRTRALHNSRQRLGVRRPTAAFDAERPLKKLQNLLPDFASIGNK
jgi:hypothetical protein